MLVWMEGAIEQEDTRHQGDVSALEQLLTGAPMLKEKVKGPAWRLVECEQRFRPLFRRMLRGVVIVNDLDTARKLLDVLVQRQSVGTSIERLVTLHGETLHVDGWLSGGSSKEGGQQGLLAYERELRELPQQLDEHLTLITQLNSMLSEAQRGQEARRVEQNAAWK